MAYVKSNPKISAAIKEMKHLSHADVRAHLDALGRYSKTFQIEDPDTYAAAMFLYHVGNPKRHTSHCLRQMRDDANRLARYVRQIQAYHRAWPKACAGCNATGQVYYNGGYDEPSGWEACESCVCEGKCPRCGEVTLTEEDDDIFALECYACGWTNRKEMASEPMPECNAEFYCGCPWTLGE